MKDTVESFACKWIDLKTIMLGGLKQARMAKYHGFCNIRNSKDN